MKVVKGQRSNMKWKFIETPPGEGLPPHFQQKSSKSKQDLKTGQKTTFEDFEKTDFDKTENKTEVLSQETQETKPSKPELQKPKGSSKGQGQELQKPKGSSKGQGQELQKPKGSSKGQGQELQKPKGSTKGQSQDGDTIKVTEVNFDWTRHFRGSSDQSICGNHFVSGEETRLKLGVKDHHFQISSLISVEPKLTFRQYFNFNHPVYGARIRIQNTCNLHVAFKVTPSDTQKLCMRESQGILGPWTTTTVSIATNSMIPYKYIDIQDENIEIAFTAVELLNPLTSVPVHGCPCHWHKLNSRHLDTFWRVHEPGSDECVGVTRIVTFQPYSSVYLRDKSRMWAQWKPYNIFKRLFSPSQRQRQHDHHCFNFSPGMTQLFYCDFEDEARLFWTFILWFFPNCLSLDRTEWLSSPKKHKSRLALKRKIVKFIIWSIMLTFWFYCPSPFDSLKEWMKMNSGNNVKIAVE